MKKIAFLLAFLGFLLAPLAHAAILYGFGDNQYYDENGNLKWACITDLKGKPEDDVCGDKDDNRSTRGALGIGRPSLSVDFVAPTQTVVYVPVYSTPSNQPTTIDTTPIATGGVPAPDVQVTPINTQSALDVCRADLGAFERQIINLKNSYIQGLADIDASPIDLTLAKGGKTKLLNDINTQIDQINSSILQEQISCGLPTNVYNPYTQRIPAPNQ